MVRLPQGDQPVGGGDSIIWTSAPATKPPIRPQADYRIAAHAIHILKYIIDVAIRTGTGGRLWAHERPIWPCASGPLTMN